MSIIWIQWVGNAIYQFNYPLTILLSSRSQIIPPTHIPNIISHMWKSFSSFIMVD